MAMKNRKNYIPTAIKLRADIAERLDAYKARTGVNKTFVIEKAVEEYLDRAEKEARDEQEDL